MMRSPVRRVSPPERGQQRSNSRWYVSCASFRKIQKRPSKFIASRASCAGNSWLNLTRNFQPRHPARMRNVFSGLFLHRLGPLIAVVLVIACLAACNRKDGEGIVLEKEHIAAAEI